MMQIPIADEFQSILRQIIRAGNTMEEWTQKEADDMFYSDSFVGGFDATEQAVCFSYYDPEGGEFWFQLSLLELEAVIEGTKTVIEGRRAG